VPSGDTAGNIIYKKLRDSGYEVFAVNPNAETIEGDPAYPSLASIPSGVDAVVVATHPDVSAIVVKECVDLGINQVWFHRAFGAGSLSDEAIEVAERAGIKVIPGACPMMFCEPVDVGHKCMKWVLGVMGRLPA
jgi:predicted CoA-binding protein